MLTITKLKMWKDPGYTRQCVEVPPVGSKKLPTPDYVSSETLRPRRGALLNAVELPLSYLDVHDMSYLYMEIADGKETPGTMAVFGWILSVEETASANEAVIIHWTPDYWRTYSDLAVFGKGTITRCANATYKRPSAEMPRKWKIKHMETIGGGPDDSYPYGCIIVYNETVNQVTSITTYTFPLGPYITSGAYSKTIAGVTYYAPTMDEIFSGKLDEVLGLNPDKIVSIFIAPKTLPTADQHIIDKVDAQNNHRFAFIAQTNTPPAGAISLANSYTSDDMLKTVLVDPNGNVVYTLPWGYTVTKYRDFIDVGTVGATLKITFTDTAGQNQDGINRAMEGLISESALLNAPMNSNAFSSYSLSGQREYEKRVHEIQRNQQTFNSFSGAGTSIVGGAIAGATSGGPTGALAGAIAGGSTAVIGGIAGYFGAGYFNDELQGETDKYYSNQTPVITLGSDGHGFSNRYMTGKYWYLVQLEGDTVSATEFSQHITNDGYPVEIPVGTPNAFLTAGGPIQIQNLVLTGSIPPEAKTYIKTILSNGVRIVENNPTGTDPGEESP